MIEEIKTNPNKYGRYFLSLEADDNEEELKNDPNIKANTKIITVKPSNRRTKFYSIGDDYMNDEPEEDTLSDDYIGDEETPEDTTTDTNSDESDENPEANAVNVNTDGEENPEDSTEELSDENQPIVTDNGEEIQNTETDDSDPVIDNDPLVQQINDTNEEINNNSNVDNVASEPIDTSAEINTDEPITDEEPIVDDSMVDDPNMVTDDGTQPVDGAAPVEARRGPGIEYDSTRKYVLFNKYINLCNSINDYIDKFSSMTNDDYNTNQIYKIANAKLTEVHDVTYDYMIMKFELSSYVQSLLFYQERLATIYKIFDFVKSSLDEINKKTKK